MYKNCIFDLYGTLVDIRTDESTDEFWCKVAEIYRLNGADYTSKELKSDYKRYAEEETKKSRKLHPSYEHIDINLEQVFEKLYRQKGVAPTAKMIADTALKFRQASTLFIRLYDGVIEMLEALKKNNIGIYLLSNAQRCFTYPELIKLNIEKYFDGILISSDCGCSKPQVEFFDMLLDKFSLNRSDCIMIGNDCISDMLGAYNAGIDGLYIHQEISTPLKGHTLHCKHSIMDGDVTKITEYLLQK